MIRQNLKCKGKTYTLVADFDTIRAIWERCGKESLGELLDTLDRFLPAVPELENAENKKPDPVIAWTGADWDFLRDSLCLLINRGAKLCGSESIDQATVQAEFFPMQVNWYTPWMAVVLEWMGNMNAYVDSELEDTLRQMGDVESESDKKKAKA
jgi:hypothetical protein